MKTSLKHLLRTPWRTLLFFLLILGSTLMLTFGAALSSEADQRVQAAEEQFHTIGLISQPVPYASEGHDSREDFGEYVKAEDLLFEGADYVHPPEDRPYIFVKSDELKPPQISTAGMVILAEFVPLEDIDGDEDAPHVRIEKIFYQQGILAQGETPKEGSTVALEMANNSQITPETPMLEGEHYFGILDCNSIAPSKTYGEYLFSYNRAPYTTQVDREGYPIKETELSYVSPYLPEEERPKTVEKVTDGSYESERYELWQRYVESTQWTAQMFPVLPTNALTLLPSFTKLEASLVDGRAITEEEFENGAKVIMLPDKLAKSSFLQVGDTIILPFYVSAYNFPDVRHHEEGLNFINAIVHDGHSPGLCQGTLGWLNGEGEFYEPFFVQEYEIVGTYRYVVEDASQMALADAEVGQEVMIVPSKSITASDENNIGFAMPMSENCASFEIKNGTIFEFDQKLRAAVPEVEDLEITYYDGGYSEIILDLREAQLSAHLLLLVGVLTTIAVVLLLLYFFVVKQKKRTAIERSLGMRKGQCRVSILSGLMVVTLMAVLLGSAIGTVALNWEELVPPPEEEQVTSTVAVDEVPTLGAFQVNYSLWARENTQKLDDSGVAVPPVLYGIVPLAVFAAVLLLGLILVEGNLRVEPIELLSAREE